MSGNETRRTAMFVVFFISSMLVQCVDCFTTPNFPITTRHVFGSNTDTHAFHTNQRTIVRMGQTNKEDLNDDEEEDTRSEERVLLKQKDEMKEVEGDKEKEESSLDDWLDRPFFDPTSDQNTGLGKWFGDLVQQDYATAEALYVGLLFAIWLWVGQEWLRFQYYGDAYHGPFSPPSHLF
eukprot:scaffold562946_cov55-Attheya_sp.AAC.2